MKIKIKTPFGNIIAKLRMDLNPKTADNIYKNLPMKFQAIIRVWGKEVFFHLPEAWEKIDYENSQIELEVGDIAYWPRDPAVCLLFGKTPVSNGDKPVALEPVNVFAKIIEGLEILPKLTDGDTIWFERAEDE
ncbi:MAG: cyclophilin-like fold protein [Candidatus Helarchaeota archaeon]